MYSSIRKITPLVCVENSSLTFGFQLLRHALSDVNVVQLEREEVEEEEGSERNNRGGEHRREQDSSQITAAHA